MAYSQKLSDTIALGKCEVCTDGLRLLRMDSCLVLFYVRKSSKET